ARGSRGRRLAAERRAGHRGDLLPGAAFGGGGRGRDDLGHLMRVVHSGVAVLPAGDRDEELLRLDDLEVVVAHAVAGAGLEMRVVAEVGVAEDGGVAVMRAAPTDADLQLAHPLEVPA